MHRSVYFFSGFVLLLGVMLTSGCVTPGTKAEVTSGQAAPSINEVQAEAYDGPKARIAVAQFKDKTGKGWWTGQIGDGMADQLVTALFNSERFIVLERQTLDAVIKEQDLGVSGRVRKDTAAAIGEIEGAELLVVAAVTEFEGAASGGRGGLGGFTSGWLGAALGGFKKAHIAMDLRLIDARTSRILAATSVEGEATDADLAGLLGGYGGSGALVGSLGGWKNTPTEKALRICIQKSVEFVISKTPKNYYRHGGSSSRRQGGGSSGLTRSTVRQMQSMLASLGYDVGTPDGFAGNQTKAAVSAFQTDHGLPVTGSFDPATMRTIREVAGP